MAIHVGLGDEGAVGVDRRDSSNSIRGTYVNISVRSSTGRREIGDVGGADAGAFGCDNGGTVAVGGEWDDKGRWNGGQDEKPSGGILQPIHNWDGLKYNLWAGDSHYGGGMKSSFDGDCVCAIVTTSLVKHSRKLELSTGVLS